MSLDGWRHVPSCPCMRCERFRKVNGMSCMYGLGFSTVVPLPAHNWAGQRSMEALEKMLEDADLTSEFRTYHLDKFASSDDGVDPNAQVGKSHSAPETAPEMTEES